MYFTSVKGVGEFFFMNGSLIIFMYISKMASFFTALFRHAAAGHIRAIG